MYSLKQLFPRIRFKGYNDSLLCVTLGDFSNIKNGPFGCELHEKDYVENGIPIITTEHFKKGYLPIKKTNIPQVSDEDYYRLSKYILKENNIVFSRVGSIDLNAIVTKNQDGWLYSGRVLRIELLKYNPLYLHYLLETNVVKKDIISRAVGQTMPSINSNILRNTKLKIVENILEQKKIGKILYILDKIINLNKNKLLKLEVFKKNILCKIFADENHFTPCLRVKRFSGNWKKCKLKDIAQFNPKSDLPNTFEYVDLESVVQNEIIYHRTERTNTAPSRAQRLAQNGDLFYQLVRPYQQNNLLFDLNEKKFVFSTGYAQLRPYINNYFLFSLLHTNNFLKKVLDKCTGTSFPAISSNDLADIDIFIPNDINECNYIGSLCHILDKIIIEYKHKINELTKIKQGFLYSMTI